MTLSRRKPGYTSTLIWALALAVLLAGCSPAGQIGRMAHRNLLDQPELRSASIGISVYDAKRGRHLYRHNANKYFIPASNTKIFTCFAVMTHLGDSLPALQFRRTGDTVVVIATGDPTLMHPDFIYQPVVSFFHELDSASVLMIDDSRFKDSPWGYGWSWDDYQEDYMPERSAMPVYGNVIQFSGNSSGVRVIPTIGSVHYDLADSGGPFISRVDRGLASNDFTVHFGGAVDKNWSIPFYTDAGKTNRLLLQQQTKARILPAGAAPLLQSGENFKTLYSQPTDSLLTIMMHRSDNFYAEQSLLMVSNILLGYMNDAMVIDTLLQKDLAGLPAPPRWVDGSGLSRYNLFTPDDFVFVLDKMKRDFGWERLRTIFPSEGTGTLGRYPGLENRLYAKTGTLSNNAALSGYVITRKGRVLIFSTLVGNHLYSALAIRKSIYRFLQAVVEKY